jgi:hypothetical protein
VEVGRPTDAVEAVDVVDVVDPRWMSPPSVVSAMANRVNAAAEVEVLLRFAVIL